MLEAEEIRQQLFKKFSHFRTACIIREQSDMRIKLGATLVQAGRVINFACNLDRNGSCNSTHGHWSKHAEFRATANVNARRATVYVYREHGLSGMPLLAKPCRDCEQLLRELEVRKVVYTIKDPPYWEELKL